jgi:hypothetical protein
MFCLKAHWWLEHAHSESMWHSKACLWLDHTPNVPKIGARVRSAHGQGIQSLAQEPILLGLGK